MENKIIVGYEKNEELYVIANKLWENKNGVIINRDFLEEKIKHKYDAIIFTTPCGWISSEGKRSIRLEKDYINKSLDCLAKNGIMVITVPSNVLTAPLFQELRERIIDDYSLNMVIHCKRIFNRSGIDWYTLVISNSKQSDSVYYSVLDNNNELLVNNYYSKEGKFWVNSKELHTRWDIGYMNPKHDLLKKEIYNKNTIKLGEIAEIIRGVGFRSEDKLIEGDYSILTPNMINNNNILPSENRYFYVNKSTLANEREMKALLKENDIVFSLMGDMNWFKYENEPQQVIANQNIAIIRTKPEYAKYLKLFFESTTGREYIKKQSHLFSRNHAINTLSISDLKQFIVPDIKVLEEASSNLKIRNPIVKIKNAFEKAGWVAQEEYSYSRIMFDIALFYDGKLRGVVEVKNYNNRNLCKNTGLIEQLNKYEKVLKTANIYIFLNEELFIYRNEQLFRLPEIPSPNFKPIEMIDSMYIEDGLKTEFESIIVKQLPLDSISIADSLLGETLFKLVDDITIIKETVYEIHKVVNEIAKQITNYQSLVERQIDLAVNNDEVDRILKSFSDECSERIVREIKQENSEQEYFKIENNLKVSLGESAWMKLDESSKTFLISSKLMYNNLLVMGNTVDFSGVCLLVTKALEVEMSNRFCKRYIAYLTDKYPGKINLTNWPRPLINQYGKKIKTNKFTLGNIAYILCYKVDEKNSEEEKNNNKAKLLEFVTEELFIDGYNDEEIISSLNEYAEWIEQVREDYRNPSAHTNRIKKLDAENCFDLVTDVEKILKVMMDSFK